MAPATKTTSKDLLNLEHKNPTSSLLESTLLVCPKKQSPSETIKASTCGEKLVTSSVPKSQVSLIAVGTLLGIFCVMGAHFVMKSENSDPSQEMKNFLGVMAEANKRLQQDAKENSSKDYDIEALTGNENEYIEMDLVLGVADLNTPEAVAAAESAITKSQQVITLASSGSDTESSEDDDCDVDDDDDEGDSDAGNGPMQNIVKEPKSNKDDSQPKKRSKIIELL